MAPLTIPAILVTASVLVASAAGAEPSPATAPAPAPPPSDGTTAEPTPPEAHSPAESPANVGPSSPPIPPPGPTPPGSPPAVGGSPLASADAALAPLPAGERETPSSSSWLSRSPLGVFLGEGAHRWALTIYGFVEADVINDSTRSYIDSIGSAIVARDELYEGQNGRTQFSIRNTRIGFAMQSPEVAGVRPSAIVEADFFGNQPSRPPTGAESSYFDSPGLRLRQAYLRLESEAVDLWAGQTYYLFGWQNYFFPCSVEFLGLPNQAFGRTTQVRLGHTFQSGAVDVDVDVAALRPAQRDSEIPDGNAGLRLSVKHWKGISTPGNGGTSAFPLAIGVSGTVRSFKVDAFAPPPTQSSNHATGWGVSIDALVPVIPARDADDRGNRLTLTGSFVIGSGIADLITAGGGASFPTLRNPGMANPPPAYTPDIDDGLVTFDNSGVLHTIDWQSFMVGLQYYLPPTGRVIFAANYTEAVSNNMASLFPKGGSEIFLLTRVARRSRYADANVFVDVTPAVRVGASFQYTSTEYVDRASPRNLRWMGQAIYFF
jgi:hypothetical protein